jgi:hypothetical protein
LSARREAKHEFRQCHWLAKTFPAFKTSKSNRYSVHYNILFFIGGNVLAFFVKTLKSWLHDLGLESPSDKYIYDRLSACGIHDKCAPKLTINPVLWGERHDPNQKASVKDILPDSLSLGNIYNAICFGLLLNIQSMMGGFFEKYGVKKLVGTGNALLQNTILQENVQEVFGLEFVLCADGDAAVGAAMSINELFTSSKFLEHELDGRSKPENVQQNLLQAAN